MASLNPALRIEVGDGNIQLTWKKWDSEPLDDRNGNGLHDQGEPFVDLNNNGKHDPAIERYVDLEFSADLTTWTTIAEGLGDGSHSVVVPPAPVATPQASASSRSLQNQAAPATAAANERGFVRIQRTTYTARAPMIRIPAGNYKGSAASSPDRIVEAFAIGKYEMTWADFQEVRDWAVAHQYTDLGGVGAGSGPLHPVHSVSWYDAVKWCNALSEKTGRTPAYSVNGQVYRVGESDNVDVNRSVNGYRLPTELEWDVAFRGGPWTKGYIFSGSNVDTEVAWFNGNSGGVTWPVGQKKANEFGIHDMSGNVEEWTEEQDVTYAGPVPIANIMRHARGGSWFSDGGEWVGYPFTVKGELTASNPETSRMPNARSNSRGFRYVYTFK
jgi:formylglycine-generating enzyme required for sulfatase activity